MPNSRRVQRHVGALAKRVVEVRQIIEARLGRDYPREMKEQSLRHVSCLSGAGITTTMGRSNIGSRHLDVLPSRPKYAIRNLRTLGTRRQEEIVFPPSLKGTRHTWSSLDHVVGACFLWGPSRTLLGASQKGNRALSRLRLDARLTTHGRASAISSALEKQLRQTETPPSRPAGGSCVLSRV